MNNFKHGNGLTYRRLVVGELPKKMLAVKREALVYRRALEAEVLAVKGDISFVDAHLIDSASAATMAAGICRWRMRHKLDEMAGKDIEQSAMNILKAKGVRDTAIKALDLDAPPVAPWINGEVVVGEGDDK